MFVNETATSRGPIAPGIFPRPAARETVNLAPPGDAAKGEVSPGRVFVEGRTPGRSGGNILVELDGIAEIRGVWE